MNGYDLTIKMRKARRKYPLTSTEQALFYELVAICNEADWEDVFTCSNEELCHALNISENTLNGARVALINAHLIHYRSGKSKRQYSSYSFTKKLTTSNSDTKAATNTGTNRGVNPGVNAATVGEKTTSNSEDYSKQYNTIETETKPDDVAAAPAAPPKKNSTPHWAKLKDVWTGFYKERFEGLEPTFDGPAAISLKSILTRLQKQSAIRPNTKDKVWTEEYAAYVFEHFLRRAYADKWLSEHFRLTNLSSQYDEIITGNEKSTSKNGAASGLNAAYKAKLARDMAGDTGGSFNPA